MKIITSKFTNTQITISVDYVNAFSWDDINNTSIETHLDECSAFHQNCYARYQAIVTCRKNVSTKAR